jgi:integrase
VQHGPVLVPRRPRDVHGHPGPPDHEALERDRAARQLEADQPPSGPGLAQAALLEHRLATGRRAGLVFGRDGEHPFAHSATLARAYRAWKAAAVAPLACDVDAARRGEAELPEYGRVGLHEARHTYCSTMLAAGVWVANVSRYAGHSSPSFTLARYVHARTDQALDDAGRMDAFLASSEV